ncbi:MAG: PDZ domain-containing protein [Gammaproteobacteria bacterium]|nr:PDZ domain-containing protein [Gammaproteobacteria bacterium]
MKSHLTTFFIALIVGYLGGISSQFFYPESTPVGQTMEKYTTDSFNPFHRQTESSDLTSQMAQIQQKINRLEMQINEIAKNQASLTENLEDKTEKSVEKSIRQYLPLVPNKDNLVSAGVNPEYADDILRRISQQEFRRMELINLIQRKASPDLRLYRDELREIQKNKVTLRSELGDEDYDQYLIVTGQNNRVKVSSVMTGSPAESNGFRKDDVIVYYGDQKILNSTDIQNATLEGDIGSFINVEILRDGSRMSLMMPRGTLGIQLEAIHLDSAQ